jgi:hypothetical protein
LGMYDSLCAYASYTLRHEHYKLIGLSKLGGFMLRRMS